MNNPKFMYRCQDCRTWFGTTSTVSPTCECGNNNYNGGGYGHVVGSVPNLIVGTLQPVKPEPTLEEYRLWLVERCFRHPAMQKTMLKMIDTFLAERK